MNKTPHFSIVIPTFNCEKTIAPLLRSIYKGAKNYNIEILVIDSSSEDQTIPIVRSLRNDLDINIHKIPKEQFNHGETRNIGIKMTKGQYVCFFSQDILLKSSRIFDFFLEDFNINPRVVAVFGRQIPYQESNFIEKLDIYAINELFNKYLNGKKILIQDRSNPFVAYSKKNRYIWWYLSNSFSCYRRSFVNSYKFKKTIYGEDFLLGKEIIEDNYVKIYDSRAVVMHSHFHTLIEHYKRVEKDFFIRRKNDTPLPKNIVRKIKFILFNNRNLLIKCQWFLLLITDYLFKTFILIKLNFHRNY